MIEKEAAEEMAAKALLEYFGNCQVNNDLDRTLALAKIISVSAFCMTGTSDLKTALFALEQTARCISENEIKEAGSVH